MGKEENTTAEFKLEISSRRIYKEVLVSKKQKTVTVGTGLSADVRFREEDFPEPFLFTISYNKDGWKVSCGNNICILDSENQRWSELDLKPGGKRKILFRTTGKTAVNICLTENYENKGKAFDRVLPLQGNNAIQIGGTAKCHLQLLDQKTGRTQIAIQQSMNGMWLFVENSSDNVFLNGRLVNGKQKLENMDFISVGPYEFCVKEGKVYLDSADHIHISGLNFQDFPDSTGHNEYPKFNRGTRIRMVENTDKITVLDPPAEIQEPRGNIVMQLFPAVAMLGVTVVLRSVISTGGASMMILSIGSMGVGIATSVANIINDKKEYKKKVQNRIDVYNQYIEKKRTEIQEKREEEAEFLKDRYYSVEKDLQLVADFGKELFERTPQDVDFLEIYLGNGIKDSARPVDYRQQERVEMPDSLMQMPEQISREFEKIEEIPITLSLKDVGMAGIVGKRFQLYNMLKIMILDLAVRHSSEEVQMMCCIAEEEKEKFGWLRFLPHIQNPGMHRRNILCDTESRNTLYEYLYKELSLRDKNHRNPRLLVFVYDDGEIQKHPLFQMVDRAKEKGITFLFFREFEEMLPNGCEKVVMLQDDYTGSKIDVEDGTRQEQFSIYSLADREMEKAVYKLAPVYEEEINLESSLVKNITFFELLHIYAPKDVNLAVNWSSAQVYKTLAAPLGVNAKQETVYLDLHEKAHGPHGLVAGTTGSGKSEILQSYILSMALLYHPYEVAFVIIDFKGGGMVNQFRNLPHLMGAITNIDGKEIDRSLSSIRAELKKRQELFAEYEVNHIDAYIKLYRQGSTKTPLPHLIIIVDEFAELKKEQPDFMKELVSAARIGRSLGVHLILATQKPSGVVDPQIWSNSRFKLCLKVQTQADSNEVIKTPLAAEIREPGRAYLQVGNNEIFELFQSAYSGASANADPGSAHKGFSISKVSLSGKRTTIYKEKGKTQDGQGETQLASVVSYISGFCERTGLKRLPFICLPPLLERIVGETLERETDLTGGLTAPVGIYDDPSTQYQGEFHINVTAANTMIIGSAQYGKTNLLQTLLKGLTEKYSPAELQLYLLDFGTMVFRNFEELHHVGGVVCSTEDEKLRNLFKLLNQEVQLRKEKLAKAGVSSYSSYLEAGLSDIPQIVVFIDNLTAMKELYLIENDFLLPLCREGLALGISFVIANAQTTGIGYKYLANFGCRIALYCNDSGEYSSMLNCFRMQPENLPGRCLMELDKKVYEAQTYLAFEGEKEIQRVKHILSFVEEMNARYPDQHAKTIQVVPKKVTREVLEKRFHSTSDGDQLYLGVEYANVQPVSLSFASQELLGIAGKDELGRTRFVKTLLKELCRIGARLYIVDDTPGTLEEWKEQEQTELYSKKTEELSELLEDLKIQLEERLERIASEGMGWMEKEPPYVLVIQNRGAIPAMGADKALLALYKEIQAKGKDARLLILYTDLENASVPFNAPEPLKQLKDRRQLLLFEELNQIKVVDIPLLQQKSNKKPLETGDAFWLRGSEVIRLRVLEQ